MAELKRLRSTKVRTDVVRLEQSLALRFRFEAMKKTKLRRPQSSRMRSGKLLRGRLTGWRNPGLAFLVLSAVASACSTTRQGRRSDAPACDRQHATDSPNNSLRVRHVQQRTE